MHQDQKRYRGDFIGFGIGACTVPGACVSQSTLPDPADRIQMSTNCLTIDLISNS